VRIDPMINGKRVPTVSIGGKNGYFYVLNALNGGPVPGFPVKEVKIPDVTNGAGAIQNNAWPTQPEAFGGAADILPHCMTAAVGAQMIPGYPTAPNGTPI